MSGRQHANVVADDCLLPSLCIMNTTTDQDELDPKSRKKLQNRVAQRKYSELRTKTFHFL